MSYLKYGLFFLGGVAVGALGAVIASRGKLDVKPFVTDILSRGMDIRDAVMAKAETLKEDVEDMAAEARDAQEQRKSRKQDDAAAEAAEA